MIKIDNPVDLLATLNVLADIENNVFEIDEGDDVYAFEVPDTEKVQNLIKPYITIDYINFLVSNDLHYKKIVTGYINLEVFFKALGDIDPDYYPVFDTQTGELCFRKEKL